MDRAHPLPRSRCPGAVMLVLLLASCGGPGSRAGDTAERDPASLLASAESGTKEDTVRDLVSRQRALFSAMLRRDTAGIVELLRFQIDETPLYVRRVTVDSAGRPVIPARTGGGFLALAGGYVPDGLDTIPEEFTVRRLGPGLAWVIAELDEPGRIIMTSWVLDSDEWLATGMSAWTVDPSFVQRIGTRR